MNRPAIRMTDEVAAAVLNDALRLTGENARLTVQMEQLRAALERAKGHLKLARHPELQGVVDAYNVIVDALAVPSCMAKEKDNQ